MKNYHKYQSCIEACLKCAAVCNHCASSCKQEADIKMMAKCIQLDMECAAICYASVQLMSGAAKRQKSFARSVRIFATPVVLNVAGIQPIIARNVRKHVQNALMNVKHSLLKKSFN